MNIIGAIISGLTGTLAISMVMALAPRMGLPKMDIVDLLSTMFGKENRILGWMMHLMMGVIFAIVYSLVWSFGIGGPTYVSGLIFGAIHWLIVGVIMGMIPMLHQGIKSGDVEAPGLWMTKQGGAMAFFGGLLGHMVFGLVVALVYNIL